MVRSVLAKEEKKMYQKIVIVGNLGGDPEMRYTPSGTPVTNFSVATNRVWNDQQGEQHKETTWFRVNVWGRQAETCNEYLQKGRPVLVEGSVSASTWKTQEGEPRATLEVRAQTVRFLGGRAEAGDVPAGAPDADLSEDEIPF